MLKKVKFTFSWKWKAREEVTELKYKKVIPSLIGVLSVLPKTMFILPMKLSTKKI